MRSAVSQQRVQDLGRAPWGADSRRSPDSRIQREYGERQFAPVLAPEARPGARKTVGETSCRVSCPLDWRHGLSSRAKQNTDELTPSTRMTAWIYAANLRDTTLAVAHSSL